MSRKQQKIRTPRMFELTELGEIVSDAHGTMRGAADALATAEQYITVGMTAEQVANVVALVRLQRVSLERVTARFNYEEE